MLNKLLLIVIDDRFDYSGDALIRPWNIISSIPSLITHVTLPGYQNRKYQNI